MRKSPRKYNNDSRFFIPNNARAPRICPELAVEIGLNESLLLLQLEFLLVLKGVEIDGELWLPMPLAHWRREFPFLGKSTIARGIDSLINWRESDTAMQRRLKAGRAIPGGPSELGLITAEIKTVDDEKIRCFRLNLEECRRLRSIHIAVAPDVDPPEDEDLEGSETPSQNETNHSQNGTDGSQIETNDSQNGNAYHIHGDMETFKDTDTARKRVKATPVGVKSVQEKASCHSWPDILAWANHKKSTGGKIEPFAVAKAREKDGLADLEISAWLSKQASKKAPPPVAHNVFSSGSSSAAPNGDEIRQQFFSEAEGRLNQSTQERWFYSLEFYKKEGKLLLCGEPDTLEWIQQSYQIELDEIGEALGLAVEFSSSGVESGSSKQVA